MIRYEITVSLLALELNIEINFVNCKKDTQFVTQFVMHSFYDFSTIILEKLY